MKKIFVFFIVLCGLTCCSQKSDTSKVESDTPVEEQTDTTKANVSRGNVFQSDTKFVLLKDVLFVFSDDKVFDNPFGDLKSRAEFVKLHNNYKEDKGTSPKEKIDCYQYTSAKNHITVLYDEEDKNGDGVYIFCDKADIKDNTIDINGIGSIGRPKSDFVRSFDLTEAEKNVINNVCIMTRTDRYIEFITFEKDAVSDIQVMNTDYYNSDIKKIIHKAYKDKYHKN